MLIVFACTSIMQYVQADKMAVSQHVDYPILVTPFTVFMHCFVFVKLGSFSFPFLQELK
jgi:hypothetical protein